VVNADILKSRSEAWCGEERVSRLAFERKIDARHLIVIVEYYQCGALVDHRDSARLKSAALRPARQQAEELFLTNQFESSAHECNYCNFYRGLNLLAGPSRAAKWLLTPSTPTQITAANT
jgi:hypothetical protein